MLPWHFWHKGSITDADPLPTNKGVLQGWRRTATTLLHSPKGTIAHKVYKIAKDDGTSFVQNTMCFKQTNVDKMFKS